jgi:hypothetical protein
MARLPVHVLNTRLSIASSRKIEAAAVAIERFRRERGNIGRTADVCSGRCPKGEPRGRGEYEVAAAGRGRS